LPTEAEWEYACRARTRTRYSFVYDEASSGEFGWFDGNSKGRTHPVGARRPNGFGLFDMHGNVWEWCWDWNGEGYYDESPSDDPRGPGLGLVRVYRGGCWSLGPRFARSAIREGLPPRDRTGATGFRLARGQSGR
jgi:formylglycine-generating enzyme required for sulfatase activity